MSSISSSTKIIKGTGNILQDLVSSCCHVPLNRIQIINESKLSVSNSNFYQKKKTDSVEIQFITGNCYLCSKNSILHPLSDQETNILNELVLKKSSIVPTFSHCCSHCRAVLEKLNYLKTELEHIVIILRSLILFRAQQDQHKNDNDNSKLHVLL